MALMNFQGLGMVITAVDQASAVIARVERSLGLLKGSALSAGKALAGAFVGAAAARTGIAALRGLFEMTDDAAKFELTMKQIAIAGEATAAEMVQVRKTIFELTGAGIHGPIQIAEAMENMVKNGYDAADAMKTVHSVMRLLTASSGEIKDATEAANIISMVQKTWGTEAEVAVDMLAQLANATATQFGELDTLVSHVLRGTGIKPALRDTLAMAGLVRNLAGNMESAATEVGVLMERLSNPKRTKELEALGIKVFDIDKDQFLQPLEILEQFLTNERWKELGARMQLNLIEGAFGSRQKHAIQAFFTQIEERGIKANGVVLKGAAAIQQLKNKLDNATGAAKAYEDAKLNSFGGQIEYLGAQSEALRVIVGDALIAAFRPLVVLLGRAAKALAQLLEMLPKPLLNMIAKITVFGLMAFTAAAGFLAIVLAAKALAIVFSLVGMKILAFMLIPLLKATALVGGLVLLGAAVYAAWSGDVGGSKSGILGFFSKVSLAFEALSQLFDKGFIEGDLVEKLLGKENEGVLVWVKQIWMWWNRLKAFGEGMWEGFVQGLRETKVIEIFMAALGGLLEMLGITTDSSKSNEAQWKKWAEVGYVIGQVLSWMAGAIILAFAAVAKIGQLVVGVVRVVWFLIGDIIMGAFHMILAVWQIFKGVFGGGWETFWGGLVNFVIGILRVLVGALGAPFKAIAVVLDMLAYASGKDLGASATMDRYMEEAKLTLRGHKFVDAGMTSPANAPGAAAVQAQVQATKESGAQASAAKTDSTPQHLTASLYFDNEKVGQAFAKVHKSQENRAFRPAGSYT